MTYELELPNNFNAEIDNALTVQDWLESQGCTVQSVSVVFADESLMLRIECETDPAPYLESFPVTEPPTETHTDMQALLAEMETMQQKLDALLAAVGGGT